VEEGHTNRYEDDRTNGLPVHFAGGFFHILQRGQKMLFNDDAHLKNFSLINRSDGEYHLSPAYDLINTSLHLRQPRIFALDKGLFKEGMHLSDTRTVGYRDFEEFGRRIGLSERVVKRELKFFATEHTSAKELIDRSFLSEPLKRSYWLSYNYRRLTLSF
jgi:serine/threonine-protein kinase HipA